MALFIYLVLGQRPTCEMARPGKFTRSRVFNTPAPITQSLPWTLPIGRRGDGVIATADDRHPASHSVRPTAAETDPPILPRMPDIHGSVQISVSLRLVDTPRRD